MNQAQAIRTINQLLPEIQKGGVPEDVLVKHAKSTGMAPAVLERLGHVCNAALVYTHQTRAPSGDRGDDHRIVDVPGMLQKYANWQAPAGKAASASAASKHDRDTFRIPKPTVKSAAAEIDLPPVTLTPTLREEAYHKVVSANIARVEVEELESCRQELETSLLSSIKSASKALAEDPEKWIEAFQDVAALGGEHPAIKRAAAVLREEIFMGELTEEDHASLRAMDQRSFAFDRHGIMPTIVKIATALNLLDNANAAIVERGAEPVEFLVVKSASAGTQTPPKPQNPPQNPPPDKDQGGKDKGGKDKGGKGGGNDPNRPADSRNERSGKSTKQDEQSGQSPKNQAESFAGLLALIGAGRSGAEQIGAGARDLTSALPEDGGTFVERYVQPLMDESPRAYAKEVDKTLQISQQQTALQDLLINDPVISKADRKTVLEIANSIRSAAPQAAADKAALAYVLREALQYGALPQHQRDALIKSRSDLAKAMQSEQAMQPQIGFR